MTSSHHLQAAATPLNVGFVLAIAAYATFNVYALSSPEHQGSSTTLSAALPSTLGSTLVVTYVWIPFVLLYALRRATLSDHANALPRYGTYFRRALTVGIVSGARTAGLALVAAVAASFAALVPLIVAQPQHTLSYTPETLWAGLRVAIGLVSGSVLLNTLVITALTSLKRQWAMSGFAIVVWAYFASQSFDFLPLPRIATTSFWFGTGTPSHPLSAVASQVALTAIVLALCLLVAALVDRRERTPQRSAIKSVSSAVTGLPIWMLITTATLTTLVTASFPGDGPGEVLHFAFSGYTSSVALITAISFEIIITFGYTALRLTAHGSRTQRNLHELELIKAGTPLRALQRLVVRELSLAAVLAFMVVAPAAVTLFVRFPHQLTAHNVAAIGTDLAVLWAAGTLQMFLYVFISVTLLRARVPFGVVAAVVVTMIVFPPVGTRPSWLPLHQFNVSDDPDPTVLRLSSLFLAGAVLVSAAALFAIRSPSHQKEHHESRHHTV